MTATLIWWEVGGNDRGCRDCVAVGQEEPKGRRKDRGGSLLFACSVPLASTADASTSYERSEKIAKEEQLGKKGLDADLGG